MLAQPFLRPLSTSLANCICFAEDTAAEGWLPSKSQQDREETPTVPSLSEPLQGLMFFGVTDRVLSEANFAFLFPGCLLSSGILCQTGHVHLCLLTALQLRQNKNLSACTKCCRPAQFHQHCHPARTQDGLLVKQSLSKHMLSIYSLLDPISAGETWPEIREVCRLVGEREAWVDNRIKVVTKVCE